MSLLHSHRTSKIEMELGNRQLDRQMFVENGSCNKFDFTFLYNAVQGKSGRHDTVHC